MVPGGRQADEREARSFIDAPIVAALNRIALLAIVGFAFVAGFASLPLIIELPEPVHEAFHLLIPAGWLALAALALLWIILRHAPAGHDVWGRAAQADASLTRYARMVSTLMVVGWLVAFGGVIVHHHLSSPRAIFITFGILVPLTAAAWILAVVAWNSWCRALLARAEHDAADRLRSHMTSLPGSRQRS